MAKNKRIPRNKRKSKKSWKKDSKRMKLNSEIINN